MARERGLFCAGISEPPRVPPHKKAFQICEGFAINIERLMITSCYKAFIAVFLLLISANSFAALGVIKGTDELGYSENKNRGTQTAAKATSAPKQCRIDKAAEELIDATISQDYAAVKKLLQKGVNVNYRRCIDLSRGTALMWAVSLDDMRLTSLLLQAGARTDIKDIGGFTPLRYGNEHKLESIKLLLEAGADPNVPDINGDTDLMWAAASGYDKMVSLFLKYGANPDLKNKDGLPALLSAVYQARAGVVRVLLKGGANPNITGIGILPP
jgi:hypothetical protein